VDIDLADSIPNLDMDKSENNSDSECIKWIEDDKPDSDDFVL
jgi:hypothetical protein